MSREVPHGIVAGIITYNPDPDRLEDVLTAVAPQVDRVLIWDNASANASVLETLHGLYTNVVLVRCDRNAGVAVGLNGLAHAAISVGATDILFLDQDSVPSARLVEVLSLHRSPSVGIVSPLIVDRNARPEPYVRSGVRAIRRAITSGSLVNLCILMGLNGYDERLFVDWVDFEYCDRLLMGGYTILQDDAVTLLHELGHLELAARIPRLCGDRGMFWRSYYRTNHSVARRYDKARSQSLTIQKYRGSFIAAEERRIFVADVLKGLLFERAKGPLLRAALRGYRDGKRAYWDS